MKSKSNHYFISTIINIFCFSTLMFFSLPLEAEELVESKSEETDIIENNWLMDDENITNEDELTGNEADYIWNEESQTLTFNGTGECICPNQYKKTVKKIIINSGVTSIGYDAFCNCEALTHVSIPNSVIDIKSNAFSGCTSLVEINIPSKVTSIQCYTFENCKALEHVSFPDGLTGIEDGAFYNCGSLVNITIPSGVISIGPHAFSGCNALIGIGELSNLTSIGDYAFCECKALEKLKLPKSMISIGTGAFWGCNAQIDYAGNECQYEKIAKEKTYGNILPQHSGGHNFSQQKVKSGTENDLGEYKYTCLECAKSYYVKYYASEGVASIADINADDTLNVAFNLDIPQKLDGYTVFSIKGDTDYKDWIGSVTIPEGITSIGENAFLGCSSMKSINIPNSVKKIEHWAFYGCSALKTICIPRGVTKIEYRTFENCSSLVEVSIPDSITEIEWSAFENCSSLNLVELPNSLEKIGDSAFAKCSSLTKISIPGKVTNLNYNTFKDCTSLKKAFIYNPKIEISPECCLGKYYSNTFNCYRTIEDFILYGEANSTAEKYAKEQNLTFKLISENTSDRIDVVTKFSDVIAGKWYVNAVQYAYDQKFMSGLSDTIFAPSSNCSRAMVAQILYSLEGKPEVNAQTNFNDLKANWYKLAVAWAFTNKIVSGKTATSFAPDDNITRQEMAVLLYQYANFRGYNITNTTNLDKYNDVSAISKWAQTAMKWTNANGIINGKGTILDPKGNATRAEVAQMIKSLHEKFGR